jgi:hypothetical protein
MTDADLLQLRQQEYDIGQQVSLLRRQAFGPGATDPPWETLATAESALAAVRSRRRALEAQPAAAGKVVDTTEPQLFLGAPSTGLDVVIRLRMSYVPTAICHLLNPADHPLLSCRVKWSGQQSSRQIRRVRVTCSVEGFSAPAINTIELTDRTARDFDLLPTFFPAALTTVSELTSATVNALVEDLETGRVEMHRTSRVWLLARTTAPLWSSDPSTGKWVDLTRYLGAFVTPNAPEVMSFLQQVVQRHPEGQLVGYQVDENVVEPQVRALYEALQSADVVYVNSVIAFDPDEGSVSQRVRLPRETLHDHTANCIDGTVLVASLLEAMSLNPAIVLVPGHAFVGWETWPGSGQWRYLETVMIGTHGYDEARQRGEQLAHWYLGQAQPGQGEPPGTRWPLRDLRTLHRIFPME